MYITISIRKEEKKVFFVRKEEIFFLLAIFKLEIIFSVRNFHCECSVNVQHNFCSLLRDEKLYGINYGGDIVLKYYIQLGNVDK